MAAALQECFLNTSIKAQRSMIVGTHVCSASTFKGWLDGQIVSKPLAHHLIMVGDEGGPSKKHFSQQENVVHAMFEEGVDLDWVLQTQRPLLSVY